MELCVSPIPISPLNPKQVYIIIIHTDQIVSLLVQDQILASFKQVLHDFDDVCGTFRHIKNVPIQFKNPIYGGPQTEIIDCVLPGAIVALSMVLPLAFTLSTLLPEKAAGTLERELVAGVTMGQVTLSHFIVNLIPSCVVVIFIIVIPYVLFERVVNGSFWTITVILFPLFVSGMLLGMVMALVFDSVTMASLAALSFYFTCFFTSGTVWPLEGASPYLRSVGWILPTTLPTEALRHITVKGWSLYYMSVQYGLASALLWSLVFFVLLVLL